MNDQLIRGRLLPHERLLWSGRPGQGLLLMPRDALLIPFSLFWLGFAIFWTTVAASAPSYFFLFGTIFIAVGLYFTVGRFAFDAWLRRRTLYAVTDRRVLILREGPFGRFTALERGKLPSIDLVNEAADGRGTVRFGPPDSMLGRRNSMAGWTPSLDAVPQFLAIEKARQIFDMVQQPAT